MTFDEARYVATLLEKIKSVVKFHREVENDEHIDTKHRVKAKSLRLDLERLSKFNF